MYNGVHLSDKKLGLVLLGCIGYYKVIMAWTFDVLGQTFQRPYKRKRDRLDTCTDMQNISLQ